MIILGIDDSGRGPIIGPMILAGVLLTKGQEETLRKHNVRDSKTVSPFSRTLMEKLIKENCVMYEIVKVFPEEIDKSLTSGTNLNSLEAKMAAEIINSINSRKEKEKIKVIIDCPSVNKLLWLGALTKYVKDLENLEISCEHKADANHISAAAASILAKVVREEEVEKMKKEVGDFGSGYPADPKTKKFLIEKGKEFSNSGIFRKTWTTWKKMYPEKKQETLADF